jgi:DNA polymerase-3 subunit gamma/tau
MLGTLDQHHLVHLLRALTAGDAAAVVAVADDLALRGLSFQSALADMAVMLSRVAIAQRLGHAPPDDPLASDIEALASALAPDETQLFYTVAVHSRRELSLAPDEYAGFVMACLRMLALLPADRVPPVIAEPSPSVAAEAPLAPVASAAPAGAMAGPGTEPARGVGATVRTDADIAPPASLDVPDAVEAMAEEVGDWTQDVPEPTEDFDLPVSSAVNDMDPVPVLSTLSPAPRRVDIETPDPARMTAADWPALAASLPVGGAARALAVNSEWLAGDERRIRLRVAIHSLVESSSQDRLRTVLSEHFGRVLRLDVEYGDTGEDTAYAVDQAERGRRRQAAEDAVAQDPLVQALVREFAARVVPGSVQPPGRMP